jgi:hypothetical protein
LFSAGVQANVFVHDDDEKLSRLHDRLTTVVEDISNSAIGAGRGGDARVVECFYTAVTYGEQLSNITERSFTGVMYSASMLDRRDEETINNDLSLQLASSLNDIRGINGKLGELQGRCSWNVLVVSRLQRVISVAEELRTVLAEFHTRLRLARARP